MNQNNEKILLEKIAALEHVQWVHWTEYMLANMSLENVARWHWQMTVPYDELTEKEKDSDREWAEKVLNLVEKEIREDEKNKIISEIKKHVDCKTFHKIEGKPATCLDAVLYKLIGKTKK